MDSAVKTTEERIAGLFPAEDEIPERFRISSYEQTQYLINGAMKTWEGGQQDIFSPVCVGNEQEAARKRIGSHPLQGEKESLEALLAATEAYNNGRGYWPTLSVEEKVRHAEKFLLMMSAVRDEVVRLLMWEIGKSFVDSQKEFDRTVEYIRDTIESLKELDRAGSRFTIEQGIIGKIRRAPLGVVLSMGPFNYPLNETFTTLLPAILMGNTVIVKPPKFGVLLFGPLLPAFAEAFPPGVVNFVYGNGSSVVGPLMKSGRLDALAFIGTSRVADILKSQHPKPHRLRSVLGLEAKNPAIIMPGADLELAVKECILGTLSFNGQRCTGLKLLFVHNSIREEFVKKFSAAVDALAFGVPWDDGVFVTPLPEAGKPEYLSGLLQDALSKGAVLANRYGGITNRTFYFPAVVNNVTREMKLYHEEQFGPIIPITGFDSVDEPVQALIESNYGQQVSIFSADTDEIADLIDPLVNQVCRVNINSQCQRGPDTFPFTGRKDSAEGTLSVSDALRVFSIRTLVAAKANDSNKSLLNEIMKQRKSNFLSTDFVL